MEAIPPSTDPACTPPPTERTVDDEDPMSHAEDETQPTTVMTPTVTGDLTMILDIMRTMMVDHKRFEKEMADERRKQDAECERER